MGVMMGVLGHKKNRKVVNMTGCGGWRNGLLGLIEGTRWRILQRPSGGHAHHVNIEMGRRRWDLIEA